MWTFGLCESSQSKIAHKPVHTVVYSSSRQLPFHLAILGATCQPWVELKMSKQVMAVVGENIWMKIAKQALPIIRCKRMIFQCLVKSSRCTVADLGGIPPPSATKFFSIFILIQFLINSYPGAPTWELAPPLGKSWIRHWCSWNYVGNIAILALWRFRSSWISYFYRIHV